MDDTKTIMAFDDAVTQAAGGGICVVTRETLETVCPHRERALVASYGILTLGLSALALEQRDFDPYVEGHPWLFPAHWLAEMAALAAGFQAKREICEAMGLEECLGFNLPMTLKGGDWVKRPPACDPKSAEPIVATVQDFKIHIGGKVTYESDTLIRQGNREAVFAGIKVIIMKERKR